jgi:RND superfamily putative drug exporter
VFSALADRTTARPRLTLLAVVLFVALAGVLGGPVAGALEDSGGFTATDSGSTRAVERIREATGRHVNPGIVALLETPAGAGSAAGRERIAAVERTLSAVPGIAAVVSADSTRDPSFVSRDGRATYLAATLDADADEELVLERVTERFAGADDVVLGGSIVAGTQIGDSVTADLGRAEALAFPILLLLSLVFFRGRAAVLPLVAGVTTVLGTFLALAAVNQVYGLSIFALNLVIGLGLGLSIDYMLFLVTRFREELEQQGAGAGAIRTTMNTAGRTVAYSAVTVACALITLTVFPLGFLQSMGIAGAVVALVAGLAALVIAPTLFALWGAKLAVRRRRPERPAEQGTWYRLSKAVMRRPLRVAIVTGVLMLAVAAPSLRAVWTPVDSSVIPKGQSSRTVADTLARDFGRPGHESRSRSRSTRRTDAGAGVARYAAALERLPGVKRVSEPRALDGATWRIDVAVAGAPEGDAAQSLVAEIRERPAPYGLLVTGAAAEFVDQQDAIGSNLPLAVGLLVALTFAVLWLMTGSVVLPVKAILMNALTVGSALGVLTLVFQDGRFESLLGYTSNGGVEPTDFLVAAALVFALSTDYGVFLLGRIKEARTAGHSDREAVAIGVERTGAVVTAAAILLAVAIGAFITSSISFIQQIGVATAAGVLIDAFVVRALLVPSLMALLGRWNWWSPRPLARLHTRIGLEEAGAPTI